MDFTCPEQLRFEDQVTHQNTLASEMCVVSLCVKRQKGKNLTVTCRFGKNKSQLL